ncbi:TetR/AcrR family transcriptional regulator [Sphingomonas radiodurans]|uniref:TetR/AcrR family transcriptional regulator n=1 Tax=Sphingomonas radiodurans TaxID=2890321 RepID=UPI001E480AE3|nr:TetR/AcrR family transcriptional regulator [Sphingomonas radiodurans]WBH17603.1 TetR/AcrR family transcriptional regulator [Sphingomonas radiodurans]
MVERPDGRRKRSEVSREKLIAAMIDLVGEGHVTPSADLVADRAGVGLRTVFRHFADMEALYVGMSAQLAGQYAGWLDPFTASDWRGQLSEMMIRRVDTYERLMPYKRAADAHRHASATIQRNHAEILATMRERLLALLPSAIAQDVVRRETIDLMLSFETWQRLRVDQQLPAATARAVVAAAIAGLTA